MTMTIPQFTLGDRLRKARQVTGLATRDFAEALGIAQGTVTGAENDRTIPRRVTLIAWASLSGVPLEWIETGLAPKPSTTFTVTAERTDSGAWSLQCVEHPGAISETRDITLAPKVMREAIGFVAEVDPDEIEIRLEIAE